MKCDTLYCWIIAERQIGPPHWKERRVSPVFAHREQADVWLNIWDQMVPKGGWKLKEIQMPDETAPILSAKLPERYERAIWDYEYNQDYEYNRDWLEQEAYEAWLADQHSGVADRED